MSEHKFEFTQDWISPYFPMWDKLLPNYEKPSVLEIGCFEGRATVWFLQRFTGCHVTCIDTFEGAKDHKELGLDFSKTESRFRHNIKPWWDEVTIRKGASFSWLNAFPKRPNFDIVLVDGSHVASDVLSDLILMWPTVMPGGIVIMDDYGWGSGRPAVDTPKPAIDAFLACYFGQYILLEKGYQVIIQKP